MHDHLLVQRRPTPPHINRSTAMWLAGAWVGFVQSLSFQGELEDLSMSCGIPDVVPLRRLTTLRIFMVFAVQSEQW